MASARLQWQLYRRLVGSCPDSLGRARPWVRPFCADAPPADEQGSSSSSRGARRTQGSSREGGRASTTRAATSQGDADGEMSARPSAGRKSAAFIISTGKAAGDRKTLPADKVLSKLFNLQDLDTLSDDDEDDTARAYSSVKRFRVLQQGDPSYVSMDDFRGNPEVKKQLEEIVSSVVDRDRYKKVGAVPPKGVLLCGDTGTGKTYAARAIASAAKVPLVTLSGSDFRQSPYSGVGASMILKMFAEARKKAPCIVFIDEVDSLGEARRQGAAAAMEGGDQLGVSGKHDQDTTLNAMLAQMDGFESTDGILFIAATNRPEMLDEALVRAGRFERRIDFFLPDQQGREDILRSCAAPLALAWFDDEVKALARQTSAFSPADLRSLLNSAALRAAHAGRDAVSEEDIQASLLEARQRKAKVRPEGQFQVTECVPERLERVKGHDEAVEELKDLVHMLEQRERYTKLGGAPPRGVLMEGPPGVGKTFCARALAGEVGLPFLSVSGSEFQASKYAGQGTQLVKRLFAMARKLQPCVVFVDEIDGVGRRREAFARGAEQDRENTLLQLLIEMDGFTDRGEVLVVAATNQPGSLDPALLRPGRFDRRVVLELPDTKGRQAILELYADGKPLSSDVELSEVARQTSGLSGAELRNLMNEAALMAAKEDLAEVPSRCVSSASDRISLGAAKKHPMRSPDGQQLTAIHEAGHVVLGFAFGDMAQSRVVRASIRPRLGGTGGVTLFEPFEENVAGALPQGLVTQRSCCASLCVDLGGRVAEAVSSGSPLQVSSGASSDFRSATQRAVAMVTDWGFAGSTLSVAALGHRCSDATLRQVEIAAGEILAQAHASAERVLQSEAGRRCLQAVADQLLEREDVDAKEMLGPEDIASLKALAQLEADRWATKPSQLSPAF
eukprot:TRINITY_DN72965_c0_g1_i1.p1 TRINITY_DN72965_c0_g1~~TRINITY_DN72965_c0_g1_i1.p1  ORF type:complete len:903 (+),score=207.65 TRINITY_DN72965_c0_g1_i1:67-2775(+)